MRSTPSLLALVAIVTVALAAWATPSAHAVVDPISRWQAACSGVWVAGQAAECTFQHAGWRGVQASATSVTSALPVVTVRTRDGRYLIEGCQSSGGIVTNQCSGRGDASTVAAGTTLICRVDPGFAGPASGGTFTCGSDLLG